MDRDIHVFIRLRDRMLSVGSEAVKAKVIALYAVVLSNANHRRQNVRRGEANRVCGLTAPLLNPISSPSPSPRPALSARPTASVRIRSTVAKFLHNFLLPFPISRSSGRREIFQPLTLLDPRLRIWLKTDQKRFTTR